MRLLKSKWRIALEQFDGHVVADDNELYKLPIVVGARNYALKKKSYVNNQYYEVLLKGKKEKWSKAQIRPFLELIEDPEILIKADSPY